MPERTAPVHPPSLDDLAAWAEAAYAELPESFRRLTADIVFRVDEFPDEETEREMELDSPFDLMGLYRGVSLDQKNRFGERGGRGLCVPLPPPDPRLLVRDGPRT